MDSINQANIPKNKFELRDYLQKNLLEENNPLEENNQLKENKPLEERASEIMANIFNVMSKYRLMPEMHPLRSYYEPCLLELELAYSSKDFKERWPLAVSYLLDSIILE